MSEPKTEVVQVNPGRTPADMIAFAVQNGADLDKLEKLLEIQIRYEENEAKKAFHKAMSKFKAEPIEIEKDKKVGYSTAKGNVGYSHATLANVVRVITRELSKHGLSASWRTDQKDGKISVTCRITHVMGHSEETTLFGAADESGSKNSIQAVGSTVTYLERYTLLALTGLATTDQDNDAKVAEPLITEKQVSNILDLLASKELTEKKLLEYMGMEKLEDIPASQYMKALQAINSAVKKPKEA